jgi:ribosomal protein L34E
MSSKSAIKEKLKPLEVKCTSTDCENGLHCFKQTKKMRATNQGEYCRSCGIDLVNWPRLRSRNLTDAAHTFAALKHELIRHHFWHTPIDQIAINHARRKGRINLESAAMQRLKKSIGQAVNSYEGRQTPKSGNILYYAQHTTASCCRACLEQWHGIPQGRALTKDELDYLKELIMLYVDERLPMLTPNGEKVPPIKRGEEGQLEAMDFAPTRPQP